MDTWVPRPADRLRRLLALAAALGALVAFATLARPESSRSARLTIGGETDTVADEDARAADTADRGPAAEPARARAGPQRLARPLDPSTLGDVPANILTLSRDEWAMPSEGGALLARLDQSQAARSGIRVVDARTFQPVATVVVGGSFRNLHGFTPGADALVVQVRDPYGRQSVQRYPLDPDQPVTGVELPEGVELASETATLADGRVAMVVAEFTEGELEPSRSPARLLVANLLDERIVVDLPLPGLRGD